LEIGLDTVFYVALCFISVSAFLIKPQLIIYTLIIITLFPFLSVSINIGGVTVSPKDLLLAFYCISACIILFKRLILKEPILGTANNTNVFILLVLLYALLHVQYMLIGIYKGIPIQSAVRRFGFYSDCLYFFFPVFFLQKGNQLRNLLLFVVIVSLLYPLWQVSSFFLLSGDYEVTSSGTIRLSGSQATAIIASALFAILIWRNDLKSYFLSALPVFSISLVGHRSAIVALALSMIPLLMFKKEIRKVLSLAYVTSLSILLVFFAAESFSGYSFLGDFVKRSSDTLDAENTTTSARIYSIKDNLHVFEQRPFLGIGYMHEEIVSLFPASALERNVQGDMGPEINVISPHNFVMKFLSHTGIVGTILVILIIWTALKKSYLLIHGTAKRKNYGIYLFCSMVYFLVHSIMNTTFTAQGYIFWILCGACILPQTAEEIAEGKRA
jgi:hypothetical protein